VSVPDASTDPDVPETVDLVDETQVDPDAFDPVEEDPVMDEVEEELVNPFEPIGYCVEDSLLLAVQGITIPSDPSSVVMPGATRRSSWVGLLDHLMDGLYSTADSEAGTLGIHLCVLYDAEYERHYLLFWNTDRAEGVYVIDPGAPHPLIVEVPYPMSDAGTRDEGVEILRQAGGWALLVSGATRCASTATVSCDGTTVACSASAAAYRISDVAHNPDLIFHLVHRYLATRDTSSIVLQVQGQADASGGRAILSDGTSTPNTGSVSVTLRNGLSDALRPDFPAYADSVYSCNNPADSGYTSECNQTNVQGRWINGSSDPCVTPPIGAVNRFVAIELDSAMRDPEVHDEVAAAVLSLFE
jgi:hypothetical protein